MTVVGSRNDTYRSTPKKKKNTKQQLISTVLLILVRRVYRAYTVDSSVPPGFTQVEAAIYRYVFLLLFVAVLTLAHNTMQSVVTGPLGSVVRWHAAITGDHS